MASVVSLTLRRSQACPWGLRLQGGADFEKALVISHVTAGTPSHASGLMSGDVLLEINGADTGLMTHKAAQQAIVSCGDEVPLTVQRQQQQQPPPGQGWTPQVDLVGGAPVTAGVPGQTYTKTSLARPQQEEDHWDVRHNVTAKGFQPATEGAGGFRSVAAPVTRPGTERRGPPQVAQCWLCSQPVTGVFVQVRGRPTCVSCFKCADCGAELKNVGHVQTGEKLYCHSCATTNNTSRPSNPGLPQGLAANLARLTGGQHQSGPASGQPPAPPTSDWTKRLDNNAAGMANNAEDFTKEFMKQLTGGQ